MFVLEPFLAFFGRAAEFAVLGRAIRISLVALSSLFMALGDVVESGSGKAYFWGEGAHYWAGQLMGCSWDGKRESVRTSAVGDLPSLGLC